MQHPVLLLACAMIATIAAAVSGKEVMIADFTQSDPLSMETVNDPVMGGTSRSTATLRRGEGLVWSGEVNIVSFLGSPGFCILENSDEHNFGRLSDTDGISFLVRDSDSMLLPLGAQIQTGARSPSWGVQVTYEATLEERARRDGLLELNAQWSKFKASFRGQDVPDAPPLNGVELDKAYRVGLSTYQSHKAGPFTVEVVKVVAGLEAGSVW